MIIKKIPTKDMTHEEWCSIRNKSIGGSDSSAIVGLNPYQSSYGLWMEKTGRRAGFEGNIATKVGTYLEEFVAKLFQEETGKKVRRENAILYNDDYPFAHANVDRLIVGENAGLEIKTTSALNLKKFKNGEYPESYYCQCVHYLAVTGKDRWYLAVLIGNSDFRIFTIERDEEEIKALMDAEKEFWDCVKNDTQPSLNGHKKDTEILSEQYPTSNGMSVDLFGVDGAIEQYVQVGKQLKELSDLQEAYKQKIMQAMGDNEKGSANGYKVSWKSQTRNSFNAKAFASDHPQLDLSSYYTTSNYRVFKIN